MSRARVSAIIAALAGTALLVGCSRWSQIVVAPLTGEEAGACVQRASTTYRIAGANIALGQMEIDPTDDYAFAVLGAAQGVGIGTQFLCRFDANRALVDVVTYIPPR